MRHRMQQHCSVEYEALPRIDRLETHLHSSDGHLAWDGCKLSPNGDGDLSRLTLALS